MDERKLEELFRDTAHAAPPASFDERDIAKGARRVTARRRVAAAGVASVAVLAGGVGIGVVNGVFGGQSTQPTAAAPQQQEDDRSGRSSTNQDTGVLMDPGTPRGAGCATPDQGLADALADRLPEVGGVSPGAARDCPEGATAAAFSVNDGAEKGSVSVIVAPARTVPEPDRSSGERPDGSVQAVEKAKSGKLLLVRSHPSTDSPGPPFDERLPQLAKELAGEN